jgi:DNA integrity scanning protein DisA with diadenylate cyclase activity
MNNYKKITVPPSVASAIAHYVTLADTKTEALTDILSLGYEAERSEIILRHFDGNHDELMQALICGYEVAKQTPEDKVRDYYVYLHKEVRDEYTQGTIDGVKETLKMLEIKIEGVNA